MKSKFKYTQLKLKDDEDLLPALNDMGKAGWEMVGFVATLLGSGLGEADNGFIFFFKK